MKQWSLKTLPLILFGKALHKVSKTFNLGSGSTWPGHIALAINPSIVKDLLHNAPTKIILVVGTNGKTTTTKILATILEKNGSQVFENTSGANLLNGITSSLLLHTDFSGKLTADYAIFEVDENNLPLVLSEITPTAIIALDLFRDQLDRYGELDSIAKKWSSSFAKLPSSATLILNADDALIAYLNHDSKTQVRYFGLNSGEKKSLSHAADTTYCPRCNHKLVFQTISYSHLGNWHCPKCHLKRPTPDFSASYYPLDGIYNEYNTLAAVATAQALGISLSKIDTALHHVTPAFGRQEKLSYHGKKIQIFLSKNPTGFNESFSTISQQNAKHILLLLNDRIPDGTDVSWIWDVDFEQFKGKFDSITVSGDRTYDMALRLQYASKVQNSTNYFCEPDLKKALDLATSQTPKDQTLYILPTYSAMLDVRKIITGRKIL